MNAMKKLNRRLQREYGGRITASLEHGCVILRGTAQSWEELVAAGQLAAKRRIGLGLVSDVVCPGVEIPPMKQPLLADDALDGARPDVLVIGAGVVGCAIARELTKYDVSVLLVDKEHDVAMQTSSRNDGMVHPGIDLKKGQVKERYNRRGNRMYDRICAELGVPFERIGQYICIKEKGMGLLAHVAPLWWRLKGVPCRYVGREEMLRIEPGLDPAVRCAVAFPTAGIVCPYGLTIAYAENAVENGVKLSLDTAVTGMEVENGRICSVKTNRGTVRPVVVVNAAGVFSEEVARMAEDRFFSIHPRKGTNSILDKKVCAKVSNIVSLLSMLKSKGKNTKGGGIVKTVDGNVLVGPDAVETPEKENYATEAASVENAMHRHHETSPCIRGSEVITYFTGVRAATYEEDFVVTKGKFTHNLVHAAGIQSPGLTAAPAIAEDVASWAAQLVAETRAVGENKNFQPVRTPIPHMASMEPEKRAKRIAENPDYGEIVCRCEEISRGEILDALHRPVPCDTVDGVKRRVRPGMGRCQGGFCGPLVAQIIAKDKGIPLEQVTKNGKHSAILVGDTKGARE